MKNKKKMTKNQTILKPSIVPSKNSFDPEIIYYLEKVYPNLVDELNGSTCWDLSMLEGAFCIQERFIELADNFHKKWGFPIDIPSEIKSAIILWRQLFLRYRNGDFRHSEDERRAMAEVAQWSLDENRKLRNQDPIQLDLLFEGRT